MKEKGFRDAAWIFYFLEHIDYVDAYLKSKTKIEFKVLSIAFRL